MAGSISQQLCLDDRKLLEMIPLALPVTEDEIHSIEKESSVTSASNVVSSNALSLVQDQVKTNHHEGASQKSI